MRSLIRTRGPKLALRLRGFLAAIGAVFFSPSGAVAADEFRLINLSARGQVGSGEGAMIGGFVVGPGSDATVLIRAVGPTLAEEPYSIAEATADPTLTLFSSDTGRILAENDDWDVRDAFVFSATGAFSLRAGSKDAAMVVTLQPGSYTAHVAKKGGAEGDLALLEIYEVDSAAAPLMNLSVRGRVGTGAGIMIAGFVVAGRGGTDGVLVRASGTALRPFGLTNVIENPILTVTRPDNSVVASNDDWSLPTAQGATAATLTSVFRRIGAFEFEPASRDSAVFVESASGVYTAQVRGADDATGVALVEVYSASDVPTRPVVNVVASNSNGEESGLEQPVFALTRTGDLDAELTVRYSANGTASPDSDYVPLSGLVIFPPGADRVELPILARQDGVTEGAENVQLTLVSDAAYEIGTSSSATVWIADGLAQFLETIRARHGLPGLVAVVFDAERVLAVGAAGTRKVGSGVPLLHTDRLQIASISKSMTATVVARLVERGLLSWETTLAQLYPELAAAMDARFRSVTVDMMLRHLGGFPQWMRNDSVVTHWTVDHAHLDNTGKRFEAVKYILTHRPAYVPGTTHYYTNDSYLILGNICERVTGVSWESVLRESLFEPLTMTSSGFGDPSNDRSLNHAWGHTKQGNQWVPWDPAPEYFSAIPFGSAYGSILHSSVIDLAKYGIFHLRGDLGLDTTLSTATFRRLHHAPLTALQPLPERFSAGFFNEGELRSDGRWVNVQHWGYYARGRTLFWFSPQNNVGAAILTNGTENDQALGMRPLSETVIELYRRYRSTPPEPAAAAAR